MSRISALIRTPWRWRPSPGVLLRLVLAGVATALVATGLARLEVATTLGSFVPDDADSLESYEELGESFGADPIVVLLETDEGGQLLSTERMPELLRLEGALAQLPQVASVYGPVTTLNQVAGQAKDLLAELMGRRDAEIARAKATERRAGGSAADVDAAGQGAQTRFDARYGSLLVSGMKGGLPTLRNQRFVDAAVFDDGGLPRAQWRATVPRRDVVAVYVRPTVDPSDAEAGMLVRRIEEVVSERAPEDAAATVTGTAPIVSALSDRATADAPMLALVAIGGLAVCSVFAIWLARRRRWLPLGVTVAALAVSLSVFGWLDRPLTLGMVAFCPVLLGIGVYYPTYVLTGASRWTVAVVGVASAASLATLGLAPLPLVADIGLLLGLGIGVCLVLSLLLARLVPTRDLTGEHTEPESARASVSAGGTALIRTGLALAVVISAWGWWLLPGVPVSTDVEHFAGGLSELEDARHAEEVLGSGGEVDIILTGMDTLTPEAIAWMRRTDAYLAREHGDVIRGVLAPTDLLEFLGPDPTQEQVDAAIRLLPTYLVRAVVSPDRSQALMTHGVRLDDVAELGEIRRDLADELPPPPPGYGVELVGLPLVLLDAQDLVSADRNRASLLGIGVAGLLLLAGLRRRSDAVRAVASALVATGVGVWLLDVTGRGFDPVTVALGTLTIAVGAEFTVVQSEALRRGSRPLVRTVALVAGTSVIGYLALLGSGLAVVRGFGVELAGTVVLSYLISRLVVAATTRRAHPAVPARCQPADPDAPSTDIPELEEAGHA